MLGYMPDMTPCRVCNLRAAEAKIAQSTDYDVLPGPSGELVFTLRGVMAPVATVTLPTPETKTDIAPTAIVTESVTAAPVIPAPATTVVPTIRTVPVMHTPKEMAAMSAPPIPVVTIAPDVPVQAVSDAKFTMMVGCTFFEQGSCPEHLIVNGDQLLTGVLEEISKVSGKAPAATEHFALMQAIDAYVPELATQLDGHTLIFLQPSKGSVQARLIDGLRPFADIVIYPFAL